MRPLLSPRAPRGLQDNSLEKSTTQEDVKTDKINTLRDDSQSLHSVLQTAFAEAVEWNSTGYNNTQVLILCWEESLEDQRFREEIDDLLEVFKLNYDFGVSLQKIRRQQIRKAQTQVNALVASWVHQHDGLETLLIVYFAGHGQASNKNTTPPVAATSGRDLQNYTNEVVFKYSSVNLLDIQSDVLEIFDCSYAGAFSNELSKLEVAESSLQRFEFAGATTATKTAAKPGDSSFTTAFVWALKQLAKLLSPFSTRTLLDTVQMAPSFPAEQQPILSAHPKSVGRWIKIWPVRQTPSNTIIINDKGKLEKVSKDGGVLLKLKFLYNSYPSTQEVKDLARELHHIMHKTQLPIEKIVLTDVEPVFGNTAQPAPNTTDFSGQGSTGPNQKQSATTEDSSTSFNGPVRGPLPTLSGDYSYRRPYHDPIQDGLLIPYGDEYQKLNSKLQICWADSIGSLYTTSIDYKTVEVLMLSWAEDADDLQVEEEVNALKTVFEDIYFFNVTRHSIKMSHNRSAQVQVNAIVASWVYDHDGSKTLMIVYFAGHGKPTYANGPLELNGYRYSNTSAQAYMNRVIWNNAEANLRYIASDVLGIFDCCYAGTLGVRGVDAQAFEYIAACGRDDTTSRPGDHSFTAALIWALKELARTSVHFTTVDLLRKVSQAPYFPTTQTPILSSRRDATDNKRIILHPLFNKMETNPPSKGMTSGTLPGQFIVTLGFHFDTMPVEKDIEMLGSYLSHSVRRGVLKTDMIIWGGISAIVVETLFSPTSKVQKRKPEIPATEQQSNSDTEVINFVPDLRAEHRIWEKVHKDLQEEFELEARKKKRNKTGMEKDGSLDYFPIKPEMESATIERIRSTSPCPKQV